MKTSAEALGGSGRRVLDHELAIVRGAIALVASGAVRHVECGGLRFGLELLEPLQAAGREANVRVTAIWAIDEGVIALAIDRVDG